MFEDRIELQPLLRRGCPTDMWAVDGGQSVVADARCLQMIVTRASRIRWRNGVCVVEDEGALMPTLLGCGGERLAIAPFGLPVRSESTVDINSPFTVGRALLSPELPRRRSSVSGGHAEVVGKVVGPE